MIVSNLKIYNRVVGWWLNGILVKLCLVEKFWLWFLSLMIYKNIFELFIN